MHTRRMHAIRASTCHTHAYIHAHTTLKPLSGRLKGIANGIFVPFLLFFLSTCFLAFGRKKEQAFAIAFGELIKGFCP